MKRNATGKLGNLDKSLRKSLQGLMQDIGESGHHVWVRYDPEVKAGLPRFTIIVNYRRVEDTDNPLRALREWWKKNAVPEVQGN